MRIRVNTKDVSLSFPLPNALVLNDLTARLCASAVRREEGEPTIDRETLSQLFSLLREAGDLLGDTPFVEVDSANGEHVRIML